MNSNKKKQQTKALKERDIPAEDSIKMYLHCGECLKEIPDGVSPMEWSKIQAGWTKIGLQIWCNRHDINICHIDFQRVQHPANTGRAKEKGAEDQ